MIRLLKYILVLSGITFLVSYFAFLFLNHGLRNQKNDAFPVINELVKSNENHEVLFVGSSLAKNNINPIVFDSVSHLNSYNFGYPGAKIDHGQMIINRYLHSNHPTPKKIVLIIEPYVLDTTLEINFPVQYYPYYKDPIIYDYVSKYDEDIKLIKYFPFIGITKYNDYLKNLGITGVLFPDRVTSSLIKGFEPLDETTWKKGKEVPENATNEDLKKSKNNSKYGLKCLSEICRQCSLKNIKLYFVFPPTFHSKDSKPYDATKFMISLVPIITQYGVTLMDHTDLDLCGKKELFFDRHHLNKEGAIIYSKILAASMNL